ncbi:hypothetical protein DESC_720444 [Desulfosarcina cetonica]|uniref:hypothetical protein n=1 Tax=Desulfosarcina cetonica TaxID=90730 RepID=UPI0006D18432|nr:hypothetical protein [Desulfosarcina cetonica]VTR69066.1 hypothetical protein DESC_720444 [Desulfosarcina cetonica]
MTRSPCRDCPNRKKDKNKCAATCPLLNRVQRFQAASMAPTLFSAVDIADEGRYGLATVFEGRSSRAHPIAY